MPRLRSHTAILLVLAVWMLMPLPTQAYLDPGNGSYFIQVIIAGAVGGMVAGRMYLRQFFGKIKNLLTRRQTPPSGQ